MTYTSKEQAIYNLLADYATDCSCAGFDEIKDELNIPVSVARGVVTSLVKKKMVVVDEDNDIVWAIHRGTGADGFWGDYNISADDQKASRIKDEEVAA